MWPDYDRVGVQLARRADLTAAGHIQFLAAEIERGDDDRLFRPGV